MNFLSCYFLALWCDLMWSCWCLPWSFNTQVVLLIYELVFSPCSWLMSLLQSKCTLAANVVYSVFLTMVWFHVQVLEYLRNASSSGDLQPLFRQCDRNWTLQSIIIGASFSQMGHNQAKWIWPLTSVGFDCLQDDDVMMMQCQAKTWT